RVALRPRMLAAWEDSSPTKTAVRARRLVWLADLRLAGTEAEGESISWGEGLGVKAFLVLPTSNTAPAWPRNDNDSLSDINAPLKLGCYCASVINPLLQ